MEEKINIAQILTEQNVPIGAKFWSNAYGDVYLSEIEEENELIYLYCFSVSLQTNERERFECVLDKYGRWGEEGECLLFPSKEQRDWTKYKYIPQINVDDLVNEYLHIDNSNNERSVPVMTPKLKAIIKMLAVAEYLNDGWKPNWNDGKMKYQLGVYMYQNFIQEINVLSSIRNNESICYFKTEELARKAIEILGEEIIKIAQS